MEQDEAFLNPDIFNVHDITEIEGKDEEQLFLLEFLMISSP